MTDRAKARHLCRRAAPLLRRDPSAATSLLVEATRLDPAFHTGWFDLGLLHKWSGSWEDALACNLRAAELVGERADEPAWWNLGIAATALRRWDLARRAWRAYGIDTPAGEGPIDGDHGYAAVRINLAVRPELVWGRRLDPARIRIESVPLPDSGHRWGDVVLHDGEPVATRQAAGSTYLVFDQLDRWEASPTPTLSATVSAGSPGMVDALLTALESAGLTAEDWTTHTTTSCGACSTDTHHQAMAAATAPNHEHAVGIAATLGDARPVIEEWERSHDGRCRDLTVT